jgi:hypothetical protein
MSMTVGAQDSRDIPEPIRKNIRLCRIYVSEIKSGRMLAAEPSGKILKSPSIWHNPMDN